MLDNFIKMITDVSNEAGTFFSKIKDKNTFRRVVYASFLIARADGNFDSDEKKALGKSFAIRFPQFKLTDILNVLGDANKKIDFNEDFGIREIMEDIGKASGDDAALIVRTACYIGATDGDFDDDEKKVAKSICVAMGLSPSTYGL